MIIKKLLILTIAFSSLTFSTFAQDFIQEETPKDNSKQKPDLSDRMIYGGNFWFGFGNVRSIEISPMVGYFLKPEKIIVGTSFFYNYYENRFYNFSTDMYGLRPFVQYFLIKDINETLNINTPTETAIILHCENEMMSLNKNLFQSSPLITPDANRILVNSVFIGGGIRQSAGTKAGMFLVILWNLSQNPYYPYASPIIRFGFNF